MSRAPDRLPVLLLSVPVRALRRALPTLILTIPLCHPALANPMNIPGAGGIIDVKRKSIVELRFTNVVRQRYDLSCGAAALATLLRYFYNRKVEEQTLIADMIKHGDRAKIAKAGFSMLELKQYGDRHGYVVRGFRIKKVEALTRLKIPVLGILTTRGYGHFVVIKGARNGEVFVADPAFGNRSYSLAEFGKGWNGIILVFLSRKLAPDNRFSLTASLRAPVGGVRHLLDRNLTHIRPLPGEF